MKKGQVSRFLMFKECFQVCKGVSHIYVISVNAHHSPKARATFHTGGRNWDHSIEGLWLRGIQLWDRARLQTPPSDYPHPLLSTSACSERQLTWHGDPKGEQIPFWPYKVRAELQSSGRHLPLPSEFLAIISRNHLPHQRPHIMSPHGHKVFNLQSPLFSTPTPNWPTHYQHSDQFPLI